MSRDEVNSHEDRSLLVWILGILASTLSSTVEADAFANVHYDGRIDELVATMIYRGTNPNHTFTLQWDVCRRPAEGDKPQEIAAQVLDSQWDDAALHPFKKTVRFSLANLPCRPVKVTLRTAPHFLYTLFVPRAPAK